MMKFITISRYELGLLVMFAGRICFFFFGYPSEMLWSICCLFFYTLASAELRS
jgi:hypothetical protein